MPPANDDYRKRLAARKRLLARAAQKPKNNVTRFASKGVKNKDDKIITYGGKAMAFLAPNPEAIVRGILDPIGTTRGVAEVSSYTNPATLLMRGANAASGKGFTRSLFGGDSQDIEQALEIAGIIPIGKAAKLGKAAKRAPEFLPVPGTAAGGIGFSPSQAAERMSRIEAQPLLDEVPLAKKRGGRGTPRSQQTPTQAARITSKQALKAQAATNQGKQLTYDLRHTLYDRVKEIDKRALSIDPEAKTLKPPKGDKKAFVTYISEMKRLLRDARQDFPDFNLNELELSHITPLTQGGSNTWSNLRLMPRQLNQDQGTALYSAWRYASMGLLDPRKVARGTALGGEKGSSAITGRLAQGIG